jgi:DNA-binding XRE family transcriptional regulator
MAERAVSQRQLAETIGISKNTLSATFTGKRCFDTDEVDNICKFLCISDSQEKADIFLAHQSHFRDDSEADDSN